MEGTIWDATAGHGGAPPAWGDQRRHAAPVLVAHGEWAVISMSGRRARLCNPGRGREPAYELTSVPTSPAAPQPRSRAAPQPRSPNTIIARRGTIAHRHRTPGPDETAGTA
jgi:hypothetical protein